ncbi:DUF3549 family protein [Larsenimonas suaedae]|uniref:DUF3549 family protein n=1 Tax=Larsenimonas suaedae TaxID=1851019 RepID=A0ABU1H084_9GAMM|nr:DUF3549 family protein [Larsenimonas suaedae]MCM2972839.1 DUF3549 family protein [Larsenimonas suaedae]MDR5896938.1 DUF3549 family protein [Larsenimonas suaedae]
MSSAPVTLGSLFEQAGIEPLYIHLGREISRCDHATFEAFETQQAPWPSPWQQRAHLGIVFELEGASASTTVVWFLAFPLDEQGFLDPAMRDGFIHRLLHTLGQQPLDTLAASEEVVPLMKDNPLAFEPSDLSLALFHALVAREQHRPASSHCEMAEAYFNGSMADRHWEVLGWQGVADYVMRRDGDSERHLAPRLDTLPDPALVALNACLEFCPPLSGELIEALKQRSLSASSSEVRQSCLRAGLASARPEAAEWANDVLEKTSVDDETLAVLAVRGWHHLEHETRLHRFLDQLSKSSTLDMAQWLKSLALLPRLRLPLLMMLKNAPDDSLLARRLDQLTT